MSFLGLGGQNPNGPSNPQKLLAAEAELDMVTDMFNRLVESCHAKCIKTDYATGDLNGNESLCLDRCVAKYFDVNTKVGEVSISDIAHCNYRCDVSTTQSNYFTNYSTCRRLATTVADLSWVDPKYVHRLKSYMSKKLSVAW